MKIWIPSILTTTLMIALITETGKAQSVEQRAYNFRMEITQDVATRTFVIGEFGTARNLRPPVELPVTEKNKERLTVRMKHGQTGNHFLIEPILFGLASSILPEQIKEQIIWAMKKKANDKMPMQITGFTCDLGSQAANDKLAKQRAVVVAELLKDNGFLVSSVEGKGKQGYISDRPQMRYLNRRVEIQTGRQSNQE